MLGRVRRRFAANGAWLVINVIAHNLSRWCGRVGMGAGIVTADTMRRRYYSTPGRVTTSGRQFTLHMPARWPWAEQFIAALITMRGIVLAT